MKELVVPATMDHFEEVMAFVAEGAKEAGFDAGVIGKISLAAEEAVVNVINYAYGEGTGDLEVACDASTGSLVVQVRDRGVAFDPLAREEPDIAAPAEERPIGGLGIFLVRKVMDEVTYERRDGQNILTMTKKR